MRPFLFFPKDCPIGRHSPDAVDSVSLFLLYRVCQAKPTCAGLVGTGNFEVERETLPVSELLARPGLHRLAS